MSTSDWSVDQGPIQRLIILHLDLPELATGTTLDESASESELAEQILYFYSYTQQDHSSYRHGFYSQPDAIQFAGLCSALFYLPKAIDYSMEGDDDESTTEVALEDSYLVFERIEDPSIISVAQIAKGRKDTSPRCTPAAVGSALQRTHLLFYLLRGGGIHRRLCSSDDGSGTCRYPGMDKIYTLRKEIRKLTTKVARSTGQEHANYVETLLQRESDLSDILEIMPITTIRNDLIVHYEAFLGEFTTCCAANCGAGRSIVEQLPLPIYTTSGSHISHSLPLKNDSSAVDILNASIQEFLEKEAEREKGQLRVFGITLFIGGLVKATQTIDTKFSIKSEISNILMWYLTSFEFEVNKQQESLSRRETQNKIRLEETLRKLPIALEDLDESPVQVTKTLGLGFVSPPPLSLLSSIDDENSFEGPHEDRRVWAPRIYLPVDSSSSSEASINARISLFKHGDISFLLYIDQLPDDDNDEEYIDLFQDIAEELSHSLFITFNSYDEKSTHFDTVPWEEPGQDIIYINHQKQSLILYSSKNNDFDIHQTTVRLNLFNRRPRNGSKYSKQRRIVDLGLDCRYMLSSHFTFDAILAFDDCMSCMQERKDKQGHEECYEICSVLTSGWILACCTDEYELYVFLDKGRYVTLIDVHQAVDRIRQEFLHLSR